MRNSALAVAAALTAALAAAPAPAQLQDTFGVVAPHVFTVVARRGDQLSLGTGVAVAGGVIITAAHVVPEGTARILVGRQGPVLENLMTPASLLAADRKADIAVLAVPGRSVGLPLVELPVLSGEELWAFGYEYHAEGSRRTAVLRMARASVGQRWRDFFQVDGAFQKGFSGGPLVTRGGRVAGILSFSTPQTASLAYMVPAHEITRVLPVVGPQPEPQRTPAHDTAIIPGTALGPAVLYLTTLSAVSRAFGAPCERSRSSDGTVLLCTWMLRAPMYRSPDRNLAVFVVSYDALTELVRVAATDAVQFQTAAGNSPGTRLSSWISEFGAPALSEPSIGESTRYRWPRLGIDVTVSDRTGVVYLVMVYDPER